MPLEVQFLGLVLIAGEDFYCAACSADQDVNKRKLMKSQAMLLCLWVRRRWMGICCLATSECRHDQGPRPDGVEQWETTPWSADCCSEEQLAQGKQWWPSTWDLMVLEGDHLGSEHPKSIQIVDGTDQLACERLIQCSRMICIWRCLEVGGPD